MALSRAVAEALLGFHGAQAAAVASDLAVLFEAARQFDRAADFYRRAAEGACMVCGYREANGLARRGLELLQALSDSPERSRRERDLLVILGFTTSLTRGLGIPEVGEIYGRAYELARSLGDDAPLFTATWGLRLYHLIRDELARARDLDRELHAIAGRQDDPALRAVAHYASGQLACYLGDVLGGLEDLDRAIELYDPARHRVDQFLIGIDKGAASRSYAAAYLWFLGYPDRALAGVSEAVAFAERLSDPLSLVFVLFLKAHVQLYRRDAAAALETSEAAIAVCEQQAPTTWVERLPTTRGFALAMLGRREEGIAEIRRGLAAQASSGASFGTHQYHAWLASLLGEAGQVEEGLREIGEALDRARSCGAQDHEPEFLRTQGELLIRREADPARRPAESTGGFPSMGSGQYCSARELLRGVLHSHYRARVLSICAADRYVGRTRGDGLALVGGSPFGVWRSWH